MQNINMATKPTHPFVEVKRNALWNIFNPSAAGALTGAFLASYPNYYGETLLEPFKTQFGDKLPEFSPTQDRMYLSIVGFLLGYGTIKGCHWLRNKLMKMLLGYSGWVTNPKSYKTKIWALLMKLIRGPMPFSTFTFQPYLPKQPLPDLDQSLDKWLQVTQNLLDKDEYEQTREAVEEFRQNEGPVLQKYLQDRALSEENWIYKYWLNGVYLSGRESLAYSNYFIVNSVHERRTKDPIVRAAVILHCTLKFAKLLEEDKLPPVLVQDLVPLCMAGYRYLFNSVRIPGEYIDEIRRYPAKKHMIIIRKGHYFKVDFGYGNSPDIATAEEVKMILQEIVSTADKLDSNEPPVAALTTQKRSVWTKQRQQLLERNSETLAEIESAMCIFVLDDKSPKDYSEFAKMIFCGEGNDRWFDKSFSYVIFDNSWSGFHTEHSVLDGMVLMTLAEYLMAFEEYDGHGDVIHTDVKPRPLPEIKKLTWDLTDMHDTVQNAAKTLKELNDNVDMYVVDIKYGKGFMKKQRLSPDGYIQMLLQLAYYKLYKKTVKTYEPSTGRLYTLGRTETVNPVSEMSVQWVRSMEDANVSIQTKKELLRKAINYQSQYRLEATVGQGCDRHLFALMCASRENGMDFPKIFTDKAWQLPYVLSTSQTPCRAYENGSDINFESCLGGFAPACYNGYGVAYANFGDETMTITVSSWKSCEETSSVTMGKSIEEAMIDMKTLLTS